MAEHRVRKEGMWTTSAAFFQTHLLSCAWLFLLGMVTKNRGLSGAGHRGPLAATWTFTSIASGLGFCAGSLFLCVFISLPKDGERKSLARGMLILSLPISLQRGGTAESYRWGGELKRKAIMARGAVTHCDREREWVVFCGWQSDLFFVYAETEADSDLAGSHSITGSE